MSKLQGMRVVIMGSLPDPAELSSHGVSERDLLLLLTRLVERVIKEGGLIVHGGHPTFTPVIESVARRMAAPNQEKSVVLYVMRRFFPNDQRDDFLTRHEAYATVVVTGTPEDERENALAQFREAMLDGAEALVAIGGRTRSTVGAIRTGLEEQVDFALQKLLPIYLVGGFGGTARQLFEERFALDSTPLRNALGAEENRLLARDTDIWELADLILKGLAFDRASRGRPC